MLVSSYKSLILISAFSALAACGGGGGSSDNSSNDGSNSGSDSGGSNELQTRDIGLYFNEVMREVRLNKSDDNKDEDNTAQPWLELYNNSSTAIELNGKSILVTGDGTQSWPLPDETLEAGEFLRIWGSGKGSEKGGHRNYDVRNHADLQAIRMLVSHYWVWKVSLY